MQVPIISFFLDGIDIDIGFSQTNLNALDAGQALLARAILRAGAHGMSVSSQISSPVTLFSTIWTNAAGLPSTAFVLLMPSLHCYRTNHSMPTSMFSEQLFAF
jgi:hypothetical protein